MSAGPVQKIGGIEPPLTESGIMRRAQLHAESCPFLPRRGWYLPVKSVSEFFVALLLFVITLPIVILAAACVKLTSRGPAFYCQTRTGKDNREFTLIKLRTMVHNAEVLTGPVWSKPNDSRVTRIGTFLRDMHIDEFPQLINVIKGDMSLIGPRPERPEFVSKLQFQFPHYLDRLNVKPGITGLAQLKLPPDYHVEDVVHKLAYDVYYVEHIGPALDAKIILFTLTHMIKEAVGFLWRRVQLPSKELVDRSFHARSVDEFAEPIDAASTDNK